RPKRAAHVRHAGRERAVLLRHPAGVRQLDEQPPPGAQPQIAHLEADEVVRVVLDGVQETAACVLEGELVIEARSAERGYAHGDVSRQPIVLRRPGRRLARAAEMLLDESPEAAVVRRAFPADLKQARSAD